MQSFGLAILAVESMESMLLSVVVDTPSNVRELGPPTLGLGVVEGLTPTDGGEVCVV